jgi:hypothetical protein
MEKLVRTGKIFLPDQAGKRPWAYTVHMVRRRLLTMSFNLPAALLAVCLSGMLTSQATAAAPTKSDSSKTKSLDAIEMDQNHYFFGRCLTTFSKDAIKIQNLGNFKFILVAKAPDWTINVYREDEKKYFTESIKELTSTGLVNSYLVSDKALNKERFRPIRSTMKFCDYEIWRYSCGPATLKVLPMTGYPGQLEPIVHSAMKMPTEGGLVLDYRALDTSKDFFGAGKTFIGGTQIYFSTRSMAARKVPADFFNLPKGYKKAASLREVVAGENVRKDSEEFLIDSEASPTKTKTK